MFDTLLLQKIKQKIDVDKNPKLLVSLSLISPGTWFTEEHIQIKSNVDWLWSQRQEKKVLLPVSPDNKNKHKSEITKKANKPIINVKVVQQAKNPLGLPKM